MKFQMLIIGKKTAFKINFLSHFDCFIIIVACSFDNYCK